MKYYMISAVAILMLITSMGIFGFLSKAHTDQNLVSGDVQSKIAIYDEKIKTARENIEANRKQLKQMDEAVDQVMGRSQDEKGADKANNIRRSQQRDRSALAKDIETNQKLIATLNDQAAPIRAEVRKVEAEVGPIKYIAAFIYGETNEGLLEKAVTWVIILIVIVFDPLAVIMLLAAQMTFGWLREQKTALAPVQVADAIEQPAEEPLDAKEIKPSSFKDPGEHPRDTYEHEHTQEVNSVSETPVTALGGDITAPESQDNTKAVEVWNEMIAEVEKIAEKESIEQEATRYHPVEKVQDDILPSEESKKKTYMTKDMTGTIQVKNRET
jgi:hypothetical protein